MNRMPAAIIALVLFPIVSFAQSASDVQSQIDALLKKISEVKAAIAAAPDAASVAGSACPVLTRSLGFGSRGGDVSELQRFLKAGGYFSEEVTDYFGPKTEEALKKFQSARGIVASGSAATTGYGFLGPKTRAVIISLCGAGGVGARQCTPAPERPSFSCGGTWEKLESGGCHTGWRCVLSNSGANKRPVVIAIDGPRELALETFGTWSINAIDPEGSPLSFSVTWGDEGVDTLLQSIAGLSQKFVSSRTFTHSFSKPRVYTPEIFVKDAVGNIANATWSVRVGSAGSSSTPGFVSAPSSSTFNPFATVAATTTGKSCVTPWGSQVVPSRGAAQWQPFFTNGTYFATTTVFIAKCDDGVWQKCDVGGSNCQVYTTSSSTSTGVLPSYANTIGGSCGAQGGTKLVSVPIGTQLCQKLSCRITTEIETITLKCSQSGWTDFAGY